MAARVAECIAGEMLDQQGKRSVKPHIVIFTDRKLVACSARKNLSPLLDFHFEAFDQHSIKAGASKHQSPFRLTEHPVEADYFVLPLHWTCYLWNKRKEMPSAIEMAELAARYGKELLIWFKGDLVPRIPFDNYVLFLPGIIRSRQRANHIACPVFIEDPQPRFGTFNAVVRPKSKIPTVGFCGYADSSPAKTGWSVINGLKLKMLERLGQGDFEEVQVVPSTILRSRTLRSLSKSRLVTTDFIVREAYTPSRRPESDKAVDIRVNEFFANIYGTDYTLCMRGYGNWSYRFYQTLACGRIPVIVDTECVLPNTGSIDWKKYCIWVAPNELDRIGEIIRSFHHSISDRDFIHLQVECRDLWKRSFTPAGFFPQLRCVLEQGRPSR